MSSQLATLAPEIKDLIFQHLWTFDLAALASSCKALNIVIAPYLYRTISLAWVNDYPNAERISHLLRTCIARPDLAAYIDTLKVENERWGDPWEKHDLDEELYGRNWPRTFAAQLGEPTHAVFTENEKRELEHVIDSAYAREDWKRAIIHDKDIIGTTAFLVSRLKNLRSLSIPEIFLQHVPKDWIARSFEAISAQQLDKPGLPRLPHLTRLVLGKRGQYYNDACKEYAEIIPTALSIPTLEHLELWGSYITEYHGHLASKIATVPPQIHLRSLKFMRTDVPPSLVGVILKTVPKLTSFTYDGYQRFSDGGIRIDDLRTALQHVKSTLTHLCVRADIFDNMDADPQYLDYPIYGSLGRLRDFENLTTLDVSIPILVGMRAGGHFDRILAPPVPMLESYLPRRLQRFNTDGSMLGFQSSWLWHEGDYWTIMTKFFRGRGELGVAPLRKVLPELKVFSIDMQNLSNSWLKFHDRKDSDGQLDCDENSDEEWASIKSMAEEQGLKFSRFSRAGRAE